MIKMKQNKSYENVAIKWQPNGCPCQIL